MLIAEIVGWQQGPRKPQDIVDFLLSRGGIQDYGGELRHMDLHRIQKGKFGRLARRNGMPLDTAREVAAEAGYLNPDDDINALLHALYRNTHGDPVYSQHETQDHLDWQRHQKGLRQKELDDEYWNPNNMFAGL